LDDLGFWLAKGYIYEEEHMIGELVTNMLHSTVPGFIGVTVIFVYLAAIVWAAMYRIKEGGHLEHH
jgi:putative effector of murein hydrolase LrgA (UPF0299 family)